MRKLLLFLGAVADDWVGKMSGGIGLALGFAAKFWNNDRIPNSWLWLASGLALFTAFFRAWSKEYDRAEKRNVLDVAPLHEASTSDNFAEVRLWLGALDARDSRIAELTTQLADAERHQRNTEESYDTYLSEAERALAEVTKERYELRDVLTELLRLYDATTLNARTWQAAWERARELLK